jgi:hypothetical protein
MDYMDKNPQSQGLLSKSMVLLLERMKEIA